MSSKTFKSVVHGSSIQVHDNGEGVFIGLFREDSITRGTTLSKSDAPALALAVLEAAYGPDHTVPHKIREAWTSLYVHIIKEERANAEAKEQAELEAEALELLNVVRDARGIMPHLTVAEASPEAMNEWLAVARRAREMRAEK